MTLWSRYTDNLFFLWASLATYVRVKMLSHSESFQTQRDSVCGVERGSVGGEGDGGERKRMVSDTESSEKPPANSPFEFHSLSFSLAFSPKSSHGHSPCWFLSEISSAGWGGESWSGMTSGWKAGITWLSVVCIWGGNYYCKKQYITAVSVKRGIEESCSPSSVGRKTRTDTRCWCCTAEEMKQSCALKEREEKKKRKNQLWGNVSNAAWRLWAKEGSRQIQEVSAMSPFINLVEFISSLTGSFISSCHVTRSLIWSDIFLTFFFYLWLHKI